jgi:hypothetical protein
MSIPLAGPNPFNQSRVKINSENQHSCKPLTLHVVEMQLCVPAGHFVSLIETVPLSIHHLLWLQSCKGKELLSGLKYTIEEGSIPISQK